MFCLTVHRFLARVYGKFLLKGIMAVLTPKLGVFLYWFSSVSIVIRCCYSCDVISFVVIYSFPNVLMIILILETRDDIAVSIVVGVRFWYNYLYFLVLLAKAKFSVVNDSWTSLIYQIEIKLIIKYQLVNHWWEILSVPFGRLFLVLLLRD